MRAAVEVESTAWAFAYTDATADAATARRARSIDSFAKMSVHPDREVRLAVVQNKGCPPEVLVVLADDEMPRIRAAVLDHPNCPTDLLADRAMRDHGDATSQSVANHPNSSPDTLRMVAGRGDWLRSRVAANLNCPPDLANNLLADIDRLAASTAHDDTATARNIAANPIIGPTRAVALLGHPSVSLRKAAASNPACPIGVVMEEVGSADPVELRFLVDRADCPSELLDRVYSTAETPLQKRIAAHPNVSDETLNALSRAWRPEVAKAAQARLAKRQHRGG